MFGVVPEAEVEALASRVREAGAEGKLASVELALTLRPAAFEHEGFLRDFAELDEARMRSALAAALQRIDGFAERCDIGRPQSLLADENNRVAAVSARI